VVDLCTRPSATSINLLFKLDKPVFWVATDMADTPLAQAMRPPHPLHLSNQIRKQADSAMVMGSRCFNMAMNSSDT
jgi:hypothetical protein